MRSSPASAHYQYYWGDQPSGIHFGDWNGLVFTWGKDGSIIRMESFPYKEFSGPLPPGAPPT